MPTPHTPDPQPQIPPQPYPPRPDERELIIGDEVESDDDPQPVIPQPSIN